MSNIKLNTANGSVTLVPEDGSGNVNITVPRAGVGKVLQFKRVEQPSVNVITTVTTLTDSGMNINFIPISTTSNLYIEAIFHWDKESSVYDGIGLAIYRDGVNLHSSNAYGLGAFEYSAGSDDYHRTPVSAYVASNSTSTTNIRIYYRTWSGNSTKIFGHAGISHINVWEIAN